MDPIPDEESPEQLYTQSASVVLTALPQDSTRLLEQYSHYAPTKITIRLRAIGSAPILKQQVYKISGDQKFSVLVRFIRKQLKFRTNESLFCYINSSFAPGLDEYIANLYQVSSFGTHS